MRRQMIAIIAGVATALVVCGGVLAVAASDEDPSPGGQLTNATDISVTNGTVTQAIKDAAARITY